MSKQSDLVSVSQGSGGDPLYIDTTNDRVGIGTSSPQREVQIHDANATNAFLAINHIGVGSGAEDGMLLGVDGNNDAIIHNYENSNMIFRTNDIERMRIDSAGRVTMPYQPMFSAVRDAGDVSYSSEIVFNSAAVNVGGHYNTSTGRFTAPVTGMYMFNIFGMSQSVGNVFWIQVRKNGSIYNKFNPYNEDNSSASNKYRHAGGSFIIQLNAGDYASGFTGGNTSVIMYGTGNAHNGFSGYLIG